MRKFNLERAMNGSPIITKSGKSVIFIKLDSICDFPIIAKVLDVPYYGDIVLSFRID